MRGRALVMIVALFIAAPAYAQFEECGSYRESIDDIVAGRNLDRPPRVVDVGGTGNCFALFVADLARQNTELFDRFVKQLESLRADKQEGSGGGGNGTTSVVTQGPAAKVLSAAVEYGALTRGVDGQVITLRGNLAGLPSALVRKNVFPYCADGAAASEFCIENSVLSWLRRASFSVSFDGARGTQAVATVSTPAADSEIQPVTFTARRNQISGASARLELWNHRDVTSPDFQVAWKAKVGAAMSQSAAGLLSAAGDFTEKVIALDQYAGWQRRTTTALRMAAPDRARVVATLRTALNELVVLARAAQLDVDRLASDALAAYNRFFLAQDELIASLATKSVAAVEYTFSEPTGQAATRNFRFVLDVPLTTRTKLVMNTAATFYQTLPAGSPADLSTYRDAQAALQIEHGLGPHSIVGPAVISLAGYYQYQHAASLLEVDPLKPLPGIMFTDLPAGAKTVFTNTGNIWLGQAKLALTPSGSSTKIPLSVTFSNRTELVDKPTWRAQVGVAYDFDSLLGAFK